MEYTITTKGTSVTVSKEDFEKRCKGCNFITFPEDKIHIMKEKNGSHNSKVTRLIVHVGRDDKTTGLTTMWKRI